MGVDSEQASGLDRKIQLLRKQHLLRQTAALTTVAFGDINWHNRTVDGNDILHFTGASRIVTATKCNAAM
jgi:hypothetical protein